MCVYLQERKERMKMKTLTAAVCAIFVGHAQRAGLFMNAISLEVDDVAALPEFQRAWYEQDPTTKKFKLNPSKVEVEDVAGLKATVQATREEARKLKEGREDAIRKALEPFSGIDPVKTKEMLATFASEEEKKMMASGPDGMKKVIENRMAHATEEMSRKIQEAIEEKEGALEVASTFMERVLDNHVRQAATEAGLHPGAIEDALLRARAIFSLNDDGEAVQFEEDGENVVMGKDPKVPYSPKEWLESMREKAPHWFPATGTGGGATGSKGKAGLRDMTGLSPTERMTKARGG
jgi:hypothetical protein